MTILFEPSFVPKEATMMDLADVLNEFLTNNGVINARVSGPNNRVDSNLNISWNCTNPDYVKGYGLFFYYLQTIINMLF